MPSPKARKTAHELSDHRYSNGPTYCCTNNLYFPSSPLLVQSFLFFIMDVGMIHTRPYLPVARLAKALRNRFSVLTVESLHMSHTPSDNDMRITHLLAQTVDDPTVFAMLLHDVIRHYLYSRTS